jgi:hypothetical protein
VTATRPDTRTEREIRSDEVAGVARLPFPGARPEDTPLVPVQRTEREIRSDRGMVTPEAQLVAAIKRSAGDDALPMLLNLVRAGLPAPAQAALTLPSVPSMAQAAPPASVPPPAELPPA